MVEQEVCHAQLASGRSMVVVREAWVEKSSGGKKDGTTGAMLAGKENWKKRYVVVEDAPRPTLSWYKTDKVSRPNTSEPALAESRDRLPAPCLLTARRVLCGGAGVRTGEVATRADRACSSDV